MTVISNDSKVIKKILKEGEGALTPNEGAFVLSKYIIIFHILIFQYFLFIISNAYNIIFTLPIVFSSFFVVT